jgi:acetyltransferase-like isoleucine patch superfamily enzyme
MIGKLKKILISFLNNRSSKEIRNKVTLKGTNYLFRRSSTVSLLQGSVKEDIVLGDNVWMLGSLKSEGNGKIIIANNIKIGVNCLIASTNYIEIGDYTEVADNVRIIDNNNHPINPIDRKFIRMTAESSKFRSWIFSNSNPIIIGKNCWLGEYSRICKGVTIGDNSIVAASAVVTKNVPPNSIAAGNPAKIVKTNIDTAPRIFNDLIKNKD